MMGGADTETSIDAESDTDSDSDTDNDSDTDTDSDTVPDTDSVAGSDSESESDACVDEAQTICNIGSLLHCGYMTELWMEAGTACMASHPDSGFSIAWEPENANIIARKGLRTNDTSIVVDYAADYQPDGTSYLGVYGWTTEPMVEYYIVDSWGDWRPPGGAEPDGTVVRDGGTYEIYSRYVSNGIDPLKRFWSVRTEK